MAVLACVIGALVTSFVLAGGAQAASVSTTLGSKGSDSGADSSGSIYIEAGDSVSFRPSSVLYSVTMDTASFPGGSSSARLPYSGKTYTFDDGGSYSFSWVVTLSSTRYYGTVVVSTPQTSTPPPPVSSTPTTPPASTSSAPGTSTTPSSGTSSPASGSSSASGSSTASGSASATTSGSATTPPPGSGGITFPVAPNTSIPVNGFAGPGVDPGTGIPGNDDPLPAGKGSIADGAPPASGSAGSSGADSGSPSPVALPTSSPSSPTGLAVIAILALAIVLSTYAYQQLARRHQ